MRRLLLVLPLMLACARAETPPADSAAPAMAMLTEADMAGTWTGTGTIEGTDSIFLHWTQVCGSGTCRGTSQEQPSDTVVATYVLDADSAMGSTQPFADKTMGGAMVTDNWVGRIVNGQVIGNGWIKLAGTDSVVMRYRIAGAKAP